MANDTVGEMKLSYESKVRHELIIPDFETLLREDPTKFYFGKKFTVQNTEFQIGFFVQNNQAANRFWLNNLSKKKLKLALLKIDAVGSDGSEKTVCNKQNVTFENGQAYLDSRIEDAKFWIPDLWPLFLPNGELRLRCQIKIKSKSAAIVNPIKKPTIVDDLRKASTITDMAFTDAKLVCYSETFAVHRFILSARSSIFKAMFEHKDTKEAMTGEVDIPDVDPETLRTMLQFIYTDKVDADVIDPALLAAADKYNLPTLFNKCERRLCETITVENAGSYFYAGFLHPAKSLKDVSAKFIIDNFDAVKDTESMKVVLQDPKALFEILQFSHGK